MTSVNDPRLGQALAVLQSRLHAFVEDRMRQEYGDRWLYHACFSLPNVRAATGSGAHLDVLALIRIATDSQHKALHEALSHQGRTYLHELREIRNRFSHQEEFSERDIDRALDTLELFLITIRAPEADEIARLRRRAAPRAPGAPSLSNPQVIPPGDPGVGLPECDFVYFATPARTSWTITAETVVSTKAIIAHAYNKTGLRMPLVQHLRAGNTILLVYGVDREYSPRFRCKVCRSPEPVTTPQHTFPQHTFEVFCYIPDRFHERLKEGNYDPDPVVGRFVGISIGSYEDLGGSKQVIIKPKGNNTLRRWDEVFLRRG